MRVVQPLVSILALIIVSAKLAYASPSNYGSYGMIDTPTAFMAADATFAPTFSSSKDYDLYNFTYQALPWLEATFRYRKIKDLKTPGAFGTENYDRNFAAKLRILEEDYYLPQLAIGIRDFVGTGLVGSEYLVASKHLGDFQLSLGIGWGDFAGDEDLKNPLIYLSDKFADRQDGAGGVNEAGTIPTGSAFQGEHIGWFAGIKYKLPKLPLQLMIERNPEFNRYDVVDFEVDKPENTLSYGLEWQATSNLTIAAANQQGKGWNVRLSYNIATNSRITKRNIKFRSSNKLFSNNDTGNWYVNLLDDMENSGLYLLEGSLTGDEQTAQLRIGNQQFADWNHALDLATNLADLHLPASVKSIEYTIEEAGYTTINVHTPRPTYAVLEEDLSSLRIYPTTEPAEVYTIPDYATNFVQSTVAFDVGLYSRVQIFDPNNPLRYGLGLATSTTIPLPGGIVLRGTYKHTLDQNFEESTRESNSVLPHVRTDIVDYLEDEDRLMNLFIEKRSSPTPTTSWRAYAGILEEMYTGAGAEVLYQKHRSRLGFGASFAWVKQRASDSDFGHKNYETITGFLSTYWASPIYNYNVALHVGQYLAKDKGATLELQRTFSNGWRVGAWATLTNVSSEDFGEGSFDKGIYVNIPMHSLINKNSRRSSLISVRPVQRDGGQMLNGFSNSIWHDKQASSESIF